MHSRSLLGLAIWLFLVISISLAPLEAQAEDRLIYAGFGFSGEFSNRESLYPVSAKFKFERLNSELRQRLQSRPSLASKFSFELGQKNIGSQISVAFGLSRESVETQELNGKFLTMVTLMATVLAFDRSTSQLVASFPIQIQYSSLLNSPPTSDIKAKLISDLYFTNLRSVDGSSANAFELWLNKLEQITIKPRYAKYLQITQFTVEPEALSVLSNSKINVPAFRNQMSLIFESQISSNSKVPILPTTVGQAVGSTIALRFDDGDAANLKIPEADHEIKVKIRAFRNTSVKTSSANQFIFRALATVEILNPRLSEVYLNENVYNTLIINIPLTDSVTLSVWPQYEKALAGLFTGLSRQFIKADEKWLEEHSANGASSKSSFERAIVLFNGYR